MKREQDSATLLRLWRVSGWRSRPGSQSPRRAGSTCSAEWYSRKLTEKLLLFEILNERYERRRPTILITNLPIDEVSAYLGARVFDRLREDGGEFISFTWESYRKSRNHQAEIA